MYMYSHKYMYRNFIITRYIHTYSCNVYMTTSSPLPRSCLIYAHMLTCMQKDGTRDEAQLFC
jgi:hypothetical protein